MKKLLCLLVCLSLWLGLCIPALADDETLNLNAMTRLGADTAQAEGYAGQGMVIAVLDTGLNTEHEAFSVNRSVLGSTALGKSGVQQTIRSLGHGSWVSEKIPFAWDYTTGSADVTDTVGHGTHVAGLAAGYAEDRSGEVRFSGCAPGAQLLIMKVFSGDSDSDASLSAIAQALEDALVLGADVINLSLGSANGFSVALQLPELYERLTQAGVLVCCAVGNNANMAMAGEQSLPSAAYPDYGVVSSPASLPGTVAVACRDSSGEMAQFSSWGPTSELVFKPDLTAVGVRAWSAWIGGEQLYGTATGTSMASGAAAGALACALQMIRSGPGRGKSPDEQAALALALLQSTADILTDSDGVPVSPRQQGAGSINLAAALSARILLDSPAVCLGDDPEKTGTLVLKLSVHNTGEAVACTLTPQLLTASVRDGLDELKSRLLNEEAAVSLALNGRSADPSGFTLPSGDCTLAVTLSLSQKGLQTMADSFPQGGYLEGFVLLCPENGQTVHASFLSFWGDWNAGALLSPYDFGDLLQAAWQVESTDGAEDGSLSATAQEYLNTLDGDGIPLTADLNRACIGTLTDDWPRLIRLLGENPAETAPYLSENNTLRSSDTLIILPGQLRNARRLIAIISNPQTGQIYSVDDIEYASKPSYDGEWKHSYYLHWDLKDHNPTSAGYEKAVPAETPLRASVYAWVGSDTGAEAAYAALRGTGYRRYAALLTDSWSRQLQWSFDFSIDDEGPTLVDSLWDPLTRRLTLTLSDSHPAYARLDEKKSLYGQTLDVEICTRTLSAANGEQTLVLDLDDFFSADRLPKTVYLTLGDYAGNITSGLKLSLDPCPAISSMAVSPDGAALSVKNALAGTAVLTACDSDGTQLFCQNLPLAAGSSEAVFAFDSDTLPGGTRLTALLLDAELCPQCPQKTLVIAGG